MNKQGLAKHTQAHDGRIPWLIIGAGPTGLGAARQLERCGCHDWLLLDAGTQPGGLAASFSDAKDFVWDIGGHVLFSHYDYFDQAMDEALTKDNWLSHRRESWIWMRDRFIPYPLQNNIHRLPPDDLNHCLQGLVDITRSPRPAPKNFKEWLEATFGPGLMDVFLQPYNFKVWAHQPEALNAKWVGERVAVTDLGKTLKRLVYQTDDSTWGPNNTFQFPRHGGTGSIWKACANRLPPDQILLNTRVAKLDIGRHIVTTTDGREFGYDRLISTMPLDDCLRISDQARFASLAEHGLLLSSSHIIGLGLQGKPRPDVAGKCWMYFPEDNCPFYRATVFSNYSPNNVPDINRYWSLMLEVSESQNRPVDSACVLDDVIQGALNTKLIERREDLVTTWHYRAGHGYPTPGLQRDEALAEIIPFLEQQDVYSRGRFGLWKYEVSNQDHSFMQGVELVERLVNGRKEITAFDADHANAVKHPWPFARWGNS